MNDERLKELAGESEETQWRRKNLEKEVEVLRNGLEKCRLYKPRAVTGTNTLKAAGPCQNQGMEYSPLYLALPTSQTASSSTRASSTSLVRSVERPVQSLFASGPRLAEAKPPTAKSVALNHTPKKALTSGEAKAAPAPTTAAGHLNLPAGSTTLFGSFGGSNHTTAGTSSLFSSQGSSKNTATGPSWSFASQGGTPSIFSPQGSSKNTPGGTTSLFSSQSSPNTAGSNSGVSAVPEPSKKPRGGGSGLFGA